MWEERRAPVETLEVTRENVQTPLGQNPMLEWNLSHWSHEAAVLIM